MIHFANNNRIDSLNRLCPELLKGSSDYKTILYVGAKASRFDLSEFLRPANYKVDVLEVFEPNVTHLRANHDWLRSVYHGDVRTFNTYGMWDYDVTIWWHGPEHIHEEEMLDTLSRIENYTNKLVVLGCPWGVYKQGAVHGNDYERHVSALDYPLFEKFGYTVECLGKKDVPGSNITSVKYL
jgi:hypothetical protein